MSGASICSSARTPTSRPSRSRSASSRALKKMLGDRDFELEWVSIYRFNCRRLDRFVHGRVIFAGDSRASGVAVRRARRQFRRAGRREHRLEARGRAERARPGPALLDSYEHRAHAGGRREYRPFDPLDRFHRAAFARPSARLRNAVLDACAALRVRAAHGQFRAAVGRDRLRHAAVDAGRGRAFAASARLGAPAPDAPMRDADGAACHLLEQLSDGFELLYVEGRRRARRCPTASS